MGLFLFQPFLDLRSWGHKNRGILEIFGLALLKYDRDSLQLSVSFKKKEFMNCNLKNSVILWVKKVRGCLAGLLHSTVFVLKRFNI